MRLHRRPVLTVKPTMSTKFIRNPGDCQDKHLEGEAIVRVVPPDWTIRSAVAGDIASILSLWLAADGEVTVSDTHEGLARLLATDPDALLLADLGGAPIGSLIAGWDGWRGSFYRLAVHPDQRRQGIAMALLRAGERRLQQRGALRLTAIVVDESPAAMEFWKAAGYQRQQHRARFVRPTDA
jgi:ribosomal protein S18 acetylase RimI-like enzyme